MADIPPVDSGAIIELPTLAAARYTGATLADGTTSAATFDTELRVEDSQGGSVALTGVGLESKDVEGALSGFEIDASELIFQGIALRTITEPSDPLLSILHSDTATPKTYFSSANDDIVLSGKDISSTHVVTVGELRNYAGTADGTGVLQRYFGLDEDGAPVDFTVSNDIKNSASTFTLETSSLLDVITPELGIKLGEDGDTISIATGSYLESTGLEVSAPCVSSSSANGLIIESVSDLVLQGSQIHLISDSLTVLPGITLTTNVIQTPVDDPVLKVEGTTFISPQNIRSDSGKLQLFGDVRIDNLVGYVNSEYIERHYAPLPDLIEMQINVDVLKATVELLDENARTSSALQTELSNLRGDVLAERKKTAEELEDVLAYINNTFVTTDIADSLYQNGDQVSQIISEALQPYALNSYVNGRFATPVFVTDSISNALSLYANTQEVLGFIDDSIIRMLGGEDIQLSDVYMTRKQTETLVRVRSEEVLCQTHLDHSMLRASMNAGFRQRDTRLAVLQSQFLGMQSQLSVGLPMLIEQVRIQSDTLSHQANHRIDKLESCVEIHTNMLQHVIDRRLQDQHTRIVRLENQSSLLSAFTDAFVLPNFSRDTPPEIVMKQVASDIQNTALQVGIINIKVQSAEHTAEKVNELQSDVLGVSQQVEMVDSDFRQKMQNIQRYIREVEANAATDLASTAHSLREGFSHDINILEVDLTTDINLLQLDLSQDIENTASRVEDISNTVDKMSTRLHETRSFVDTLQTVAFNIITQAQEVNRKVGMSKPSKNTPASDGDDSGGGTDSTWHHYISELERGVKKAKNDARKLQTELEMLKTVVSINSGEISHLVHKDNLAAVVSGEFETRGVVTQSELDVAVTEALERLTDEGVTNEHFYNKPQIDSVVDYVLDATLKKDDAFNTFYTKAEVDQEISSAIDTVEITGVNLTNYYTKLEVDQAISGAAAGSHAEKLAVQGAELKYISDYDYPIKNELVNPFWEFSGGSGLQLSRTIQNCSGGCTEVSYRWIIQDDSSLALVKFIDCAPEGVVMVMNTKN